MSEEKPLHVRVAEALGWKRVPAPMRWKCGGLSGWIRPGVDPNDADAVDENVSCEQCSDPIPRYDTDWAATGPLIEKYVDGLTFVLGNRGAKELDPNAPEWDDHYDAVAFGGRMDRDLRAWFQRQGQTPLLAVCHLILALKEAGEL